NAVCPAVAVHVAEIQQHRQRIGLRRDVGRRLGGFDDERRALRMHTRADRLQPHRAPWRATVGRSRRLRERTGGGDGGDQGDAPGQSHSLPSAACSSFETSRCLTSDSGSLTVCVKIMPCCVMLLMVPSSSLSPACTMYVLWSGPDTIATSMPRLCMTPRTAISATVMPAGP